MVFSRKVKDNALEDKQVAFSETLQMRRFPMTICLYFALIMLHLAPLAMVACKSSVQMPLSPVTDQRIHSVFLCFQLSSASWLCIFASGTSLSPVERSTGIQFKTGLFDDGATFSAVGLQTIPILL